MLLLDAIIAPTMRTVCVQVTISSSFLNMLIEEIVCAPSSDYVRFANDQFTNFEVDSPASTLMSESNCVVHRITTKSNKRRRGHDGVVVSTSTVPCHEHF